MHVSNEPNITMAQIIAHDKHCQSTYVENNTKSLIMQYYADQVSFTLQNTTKQIHGSSLPGTLPTQKNLYDLDIPQASTVCLYVHTKFHLMQLNAVHYHVHRGSPLNKTILHLLLWALTTTDIL